ncbi:GntR family transcriptional regulator [Terasakiispira papahanaumokuakeensis]|uniref:GntR family transcriptional regulator n=1 Tax=Terasakiispira papahanaumokuakeensis TaxID=197479 RepID=A0A1E2VAH4_9GAMM|nr:GntR family transcriptional regulator [Terasakiispira papahanaumokuakeensis]ODC04019.1 GntR family transcriptional regulator [Terasakiispira papahanaumokuakeensis]
MANALKDQLYQALSTSIKSGALEPGLVLLESRLARLFSMSRSPVRDTLNRLHEEGLISRFEGRGFLVGHTPKRIIRREIHAEAFQKSGTTIQRENDWTTLAADVERDTVLCSMLGRWEINELHLANTLQVSRSVTQQILLKLQYLGVVEREKYSGWQVVPLNDARLHQLYEARILLEPFMLERAASRIPPAILNRFINDLNHAAIHYPNIEPRQLDTLEHHLHRDTLQYGDNDEILTMLGRTRPVLLISKHLLEGPLQLPNADPFLEDHRLIFHLMAQGKGPQAAEALKQHLLDSETKVRHRLSEFRTQGHIQAPDYLRWISEE